MWFWENTILSDESKNISFQRKYVENIASNIFTQIWVLSDDSTLSSSEKYD